VTNFWFYNYWKTGPNFFRQHFKNNLIYNFVKFVATKKGMKIYFFYPSLLLRFLDPGSDIRDPEWVKNQDPGSGVKIPDPQQKTRYPGTVDNNIVTGVIVCCLGPGYTTERWWRRVTRDSSGWW
jgi:hypothetical protein